MEEEGEGGRRGGREERGREGWKGVRLEEKGREGGWRDDYTMEVEM